MILPQGIGSQGSFVWDSRVEKEIAEDILIGIGASTLERVRQGGLTRDQIDCIKKRFEHVAEEGVKLFGRAIDEPNPEVRKFVKEGIEAVFSSTIETVINQAPDEIRDAGLSEAVFSCKGDYRPILATHGLATCIGVAGYDRQNGFGFVVHFVSDDEVENSGAMLVDRIRAYRTQKCASPLLIHLRGGVKGYSEPLLERVKDWLSSNDLNAIIASEDTLQSMSPHDMFKSSARSKAGSLKLDVRTGTCVTYNPMENPYHKPLKDFEEEDLIEVWTSALRKDNEIRVVYDPKGVCVLIN